MENLLSCKKQNNLELYLNDVYEKECVSKIEQEEIDFIQTGIETLVQDLVDKILASDAFLENFICYKKNLAEVYFPVKSDSSLYRYIAENESSIKTAKSTIIKVGSFYDGTKNNFPDEFDFIFPILGYRTCIVPELFLRVEYHVRKTIDVISKSLHYTSWSEKHQVTRKLDFEKKLYIHGPAFKIQFIYSNNGFVEQRPIHVDLVPAYRIFDSDTQRWFAKMVTRYVEPETFREEILSAGRCLYVRRSLAFTEIEQHFMKNILSKKHVKVARILKYLLNGNGDGEKLEEYLQKGDELYYTSYCIKTLMIYHHETCRNTDTGDLGPCVLQVLQEMRKYECNIKFPRFKSFTGYSMNASGTDFKSGEFSVLPYLKSTIRTLQSMQTSETYYDYDKDKIQSVSGQYLDSMSLLFRDPNEYTKTKRCCVIL